MDTRAARSPREPRSHLAVLDGRDPVLGAPPQDWLPPHLHALSYVFNGSSFRVTHVGADLALCLGLTPDSAGATPESDANHVHPEDRARFVDEHAAAIETGSISTEYRVLTSNGDVLWFHDEGVVVADAETGAASLVGFCIDVTKRKLIEEELRAGNAQFRAVTANVPGAVYRCEVGDRWVIRFMSDYIEQLVGYPASDFIDNSARTYGSVIWPADHQMVIDKVNEAIHKLSGYSIEYRLAHANGAPRWIAEHGRVVMDAEGRPQWLDGVILDISRAKHAERARDRAEKQLRHQATHDSLTGLPNRIMFHHAVEQAISEAAKSGRDLAVLMLDLDRFKEINDTLGHAAGDELLKQVASRLASVTRSSDVIARLGGDEFSILVPDASSRDLEELARRVALSLEDPIVVEGLQLLIEVSIGVSCFPHDSRDAQELLQRADIAMYLAKSTNCGFARYDANLDWHEPTRLKLIGQLRGAIERRELVLYYQPQVVVKQGGVTAVEALVRWQHPERGLLSPDVFVPLAQETGLIKPLTHYVLNEALRQCRAWMDEGRPLRVAVNLAMRNLIDVAFPEEVRLLLDRWEVPPQLLELEITENAIVADTTRVQSILERLGSMGIRLSIDDFGTGYSSLAYLKRLPIDEIKIDRSFVMRMIDSSDDEVIVKSTIDLGRNLGLEVVAEGVESAEMLERLSVFGCDLAQGFYLSRPLPAAQLALWLDDAESRDGAVTAPERATGSADARLHTEAPTVHEPSGSLAVGTGLLAVTDVVDVATRNARVHLAPHARTVMLSSRELLLRLASDGERVYGLTTGVGSQRSIAVPDDDQAAFNQQLVRGHAIGHGAFAPEAFIRAAMIVRAEGLALGGAGVRPEVVEALAGVLNAGLTPRVHAIGSVGQGDLAPLAEIASLLVGEGSYAAKLRESGLEPIELASREGLALVSANSYAVGIAALAVDRAWKALHALELSAALAYEGFLGNPSALDEAIAAHRPHRVLVAAIRGIRSQLQHGALLDGRTPPRNLQDPLCFRVVPQTHASPYAALEQAEQTVVTELRSATDNPLAIPVEGRVVANGNHDITVLTVALDHCRLALAQAASIAVERVIKLLDSRFTALPGGLRYRADRAEDGHGMLGHGAAALGSEIRLLASPVSLEQSTTSLAEGIEDRMSLAPRAATNLYELGGLVTRLAAVELLCGAQAVDLRARVGELGDGTATSYRAVRQRQPFVVSGHCPDPDISSLVEWLEEAGTAAKAG